MDNTAMAPPTPFDPVTIAALLRAQAATINAEIRALPPELCRWRPGADEWCVNETLGHMIEAEQRGFAGRIRRFLAADDPKEQGWDQTAVAAARRDGEREGAELLREFAALRDGSVRLVEGLRPEQLGRQGEHDFAGRISVDNLLHEWVHHDRNHVKQIFAIVQAYAWPAMGNCRRFSEPH